VKRTVPIVLAALAVAGCGGVGGSEPKDERAEVEASLTAYYKAFASGDSETACNHLAGNTVAQLERAAGGRPCAEVLDRALKRPDYAKVAPKLAGVKVTEVNVAEDKATARATVPGVGKSTRVPLIKEDGTWKIASPVGAS
jgi:hypothetical protein